MIHWIIGHLLATCIGISLGLIGGGGSVLALPILVYVMGESPKSAIAMTLVIVGSKTSENLWLFFTRSCSCCFSTESQCSSIFKGRET